jgi:hypothetical protein
MTDTAPGYMKKNFQCPHCSTVANQWWGELLYEHTGFRLSDADISICGKCHGQAVWLVDRHADPPTGRLLHPA